MLVKIIVSKITAISLFNSLSGIMLLSNTLAKDLVTFSAYFSEMYFGMKAISSASFSLNLMF